MSKPIQSYTPAQAGPDFREPFTVLSGVCVVLGVNFNMPLVAGATWPGARGLPEDLAELMQACECVLVTPVEHTRHVTPRDVEAGVAAVWGQAMTRLPLRVTLTRLRRDGVLYEALNQQSVADLTGAERSSVGQAIKSARYPGGKKEKLHEQAAD